MDVGRDSLLFEGTRHNVKDDLTPIIGLGSGARQTARLPCQAKFSGPRIVGDLKNIWYEKRKGFVQAFWQIHYLSIFKSMFAMTCQIFKKALRKKIEKYNGQHHPY